MVGRAELFERPEFFVFRTALLPFDELLNWSSELEAPRFLDDPAALERAWLSDRTRLRERLRTIVTRPEVREALFLASPDLDAAIDRSLEGKDAKKAARLERTLVRYFSRMCGRSTPFGLFAGHSVGGAGETTRLQLEARERYRRHTRLDMDYVSALIEAFAKDPLIQETLLFRPNTSLYRTAGRLRYFESHVENKVRSYRLVAVEETEYLVETLKRAERGATIVQLAEALVDDEVTLEDAVGFVRELASSQLLVPNLAPRATGPEPIHGLIAELHSHPATQKAARRLDEVRRSLESTESLPPGIGVDTYRTIATQLADLPAAVELSRLVQVDMIKPAHGATLGSDVTGEIARALRLLRGLRGETTSDELVRFRETFRARYEDRAVPLFEVLDEENGIALGGPRPIRAETTPLLEGLAFPEQGRADDRVSWWAFDTFLLEKLHETARNGDDVITLDAETLERFINRNAAPFGDSLAVMAKVAARSQEALEAGDFRIAFEGMAGPSGASLLGRFCHGDAVLLEHVRRHLAAEESLHPDALFAEIVHLPEGRLGNVILRPTLRSYEIPFLGEAAVGDDFRIPVSDLMVSISGQSIVLTSRRLGKRVIPRLTNAHNYRRGLAIYRFLSFLQFQEGRGVGWTWGPLDTMKFLPRVMVGKVVLATARWRVERSELKAAIDARDAQRYAQVQQWRQERRLPRFVVLADADNTLPFDLDNAMSVETLVELVKKRPSFRLTELFPGPDELCAAGPEGRFVHELVIPLIMKREEAAASAALRTVATNGHLRRTFPPGSEWLYAKLYTGPAGGDQLLHEVVAPLVQRSREEGSADGWFFIRFGDPDWHVRLRLHGDPHRLSRDVLPQLHALAAPLLANGLLWKIELSTYEREIERYGGEGMLCAEKLFEIDSEAVLRVLADLSGEALADLRWRAALRGVDQMLDDLGFDLRAKSDVVSGVRTALMKEFNANGSFDHQLSDRFRKERRSLESLLDRANDSSSDIAPALAALHARSQQLRPIAASLRSLAERGALSQSLRSLASSYIHMHTNRILRSAGKAQELVIYDFLVRLYESQIARGATSSDR